MYQPLAGRTALVTGASSGIGEATALLLADAGADVALVGRRVERIASVAARIAVKGRRALELPGDITDEAFALGTVAETIAGLGRLDILVNSAGIAEPAGFEASDIADWRRVIDLNLMGVLYTCKAAYPHMRERGSGDIVNVSSIAGRRAGAGSSAYSTSKFALSGFNEALRQQAGKVGVRVSIVEPGATRTEVWEGVREPNAREAIRQHVTKEGAMEAEDVAATIVFLVSLPARTNISEVLMRPTIDVLAVSS